MRQRTLARCSARFTLTSATAAYDNVTRTAKKVGTELAEAGVEAAANSAKAASAAVARTAAAAKK